MVWSDLVRLQVGEEVKGLAAQHFKAGRVFNGSQLGCEDSDQPLPHMKHPPETMDNGDDTTDDWDHMGCMGHGM